MNQAEQEIYKQGFEAGINEGLRRAILIIQISTASKTRVFEKAILSNTQEASELIKIMSE